MDPNSFLKPTSRRTMLRDSATLAGSAFLAQLFPASLLRGAVPFPAQQAPAADTFVLPAWAKFKESLDAISNAPLKTVINTHWHFDHVDNNAALHAAGATVLAHENTKKRMSEA